MTTFGGENDLRPIRSTGKLEQHTGDFGDYERVRFEAGDRLQPTLTLLPAGCHVLAPLQLPVDGSDTGNTDDQDAQRSYSTEFGAVLEPGESFGWRGLQRSDKDDIDDDELAAQEPDGSDDSPRLVRSARLYAGVGEFVSGSTSLCTAE